MTARREIDMALLERRHLCRIEDVESLAAPITNPKFFFIGGQRRPVRSALEMTIAREDAMQHFPGRNISHIEADMFSETDKR